MSDLLKAFVAFFSHDEAFGLPKGSVRGIVFIILTLTMCSLAPQHPEVLDALKVAFGAAIGLYFSKANGPPPANGGNHA